MSAAGDGLTEPNLYFYFSQKNENANESRYPLRFPSGKDLTQTSCDFLKMRPTRTKVLDRWKMRCYYESIIFHMPNAFEQKE